MLTPYLHLSPTQSRQAASTRLPKDHTGEGAEDYPLEPTAMKTPAVSSALPLQTLEGRTAGPGSQRGETVGGAQAAVALLMAGLPTASRSNQHLVTSRASDKDPRMLYFPAQEASVEADAGREGRGPDGGPSSVMTPLQPSPPWPRDDFHGQSLSREEATEATIPWGRTMGTPRDPPDDFLDSCDPFEDRRCGMKCGIKCGISVGFCVGPSIIGLDSPSAIPILRWLLLISSQEGRCICQLIWLMLSIETDDLSIPSSVSTQLLLMRRWLLPSNVYERLGGGRGLLAASGGSQTRPRAGGDARWAAGGRLAARARRRAAKAASSVANQAPSRRPGGKAFWMRWMEAEGDTFNDQNTPPKHELEEG